MALCATLFLSPAVAGAVPAATGTLSLAAHPSLLIREPRVELRARPLPLGIVATAVLASGFIPYATGAAPEPPVDLGSLIVGLSNFDLSPVSLPTSPTSIRLSIAAHSVTLECAGGDFDPVALLRHVSQSPTRAALERAEIIPAWSFFIRGLRVDLGTQLGAVPFDAVGDTSLLSLLEGEPISASTRYGIDLRSVADLSAGARLTAGWEIPLRGSSVVPAASVSVPVSLVHAESLLGAWIDTGPEGLPVSAGNSWRVAYWYPGNGMGLGVRLNTGITWHLSRHTLGITLFSLFTGWTATGIAATNGGDPESFRVDEAGFHPSPVLLYVWDAESIDGRSYSVAAQAGYRNGPVGSLVALLSAGDVSVVAGVGYERGMRAGAGLGVRFRGIYVEPAFEVRHSRNTGTTLGGIVVSVARTRQRGIGVQP